MIEAAFQEILLASRDGALLALLVGSVVLLVGKRIAPAWRHALWLLVAVRLCLPVLPSSPASWQRLIPAEPEAKNVTVATATKRTVPNAVPVVEATPVIPSEFSTESVPPPEKMVIHWKQIASITWLVGVSLSWFLIGFSFFQFRRTLRLLDFPGHPELLRARGILERIAGGEQCRLRVTEAVKVPAVTGLLRPTILLPPAALTNPDSSKLRFLLHHEIAHVRRGDLWTGWLLAVLRSLHWFNPLVWWAFRRTRIEAESAADAWVLRRTGADGGVGAYGEALLEVLEKVGDEKPVRPSPGVVGVVERPTDLKARIRDIARFSRQRNRIAAAGAVALMAGLAAVGLTQAPEKKADAEAVEEEFDGSVNLNLAVVASVHDTRGEPVAGATVYFLGYGRPLPDTVSTVSDGAGLAVFDTSGWHPGAGRVAGEFFARDPDLGTAASGTMQSKIGESPVRLNTEMVLDSGVPLKLRAIDAGGEPIVGLDLFLSRMVRKSRKSVDAFANPGRLGADLWKATTDADGRAVIGNVPEEFSVHVDHSDERFGQVEGAHRLQSYLDPLERNEKTIRLDPGATVTGRVIFPDGRPVVGASVRALEQRDYVRGGSGGDATTDGEGRFAIPRLLASRYDVRITLPGEIAADWTAAIRTSVEVAKGERNNLEDFVLTPGALVVGRVTFADSGEGAAGTEVGATARDKSSSLFQWWTTTDEGGNYRFRLSPGERTIYLGGLPPSGYQRPGSEEETLLTEGSTKELNFSYDVAALFSGTVVNEKGDPVEGVIVCTLPDSFPQMWVKTDGNGAFSGSVADAVESLDLTARKGDAFSEKAVKALPGIPVEIVLQEEELAPPEK